jgi:hypothetical protein
VHFSPGDGIASLASMSTGELHRLTCAFNAHLVVDVRDERSGLTFGR